MINFSHKINTQRFKAIYREYDTNINDGAERTVMYIQNVHLKLYLYFSDKLLSKRTGILETFVSR